MKILYVTYLWTGMRNFFLKGEDNLYGMPAFYHPFKLLLEDDSVKQIDVILFLSEENNDIIIPDKYKNKLKIFPIFYNSKKDLLIKYIKLLFFNKKIKFETYDVFFGHGALGASFSSILSLLYKKSNLKRIYGTFLFKEINKSKLGIFFRHPLEYLAFSLPGSAVITNDGTHGDKVYKRIGNKNYPIYFWLNGIDKNFNFAKPNIKLENKFMTYIARIDKWKRQHLLVDIYIEMIKKGYDLPSLYFIGKVIDKDYYKSMIDKIKKHNLSGKIIFLGAFSHSETLWFLKNSLITFSLYESSNLGNVFLESISVGVPIIAINENNSLEYFPDDIFIKIERVNKEEIINKIKFLLENENVRNKYKIKSSEWSINNILSWDERARKEIKLLKELASFSEGLK